MLKSFYILLLAAFVEGGGLPDDIYHKIEVPAGSACFRLLNGTHQFGCHTTKEDGEGVLVVINSSDDIKDLQNCWKERFPEYDGKYFVLIDISLFDRNIIQHLRDLSCVRGILLTNRRTFSISSAFPGSHDSQCPNQESSFYNDGCEKNAWNKKGAVIPEGLRHIDWNKQILFLSNETYISSIEKCYELFNKPNGSMTVTYPLCAASFSLRSMAAGSTEICYRRSQPNSRILDLNIDERSGLCHSLSGRSVIALLPPNMKTDKPKPKSSQYLLISGRLDSFGLVPEVSPGDISVITSLISLFAVAKGIGDNYEHFEQASAASDKYLIFALFNGESFDYIGSSHMMFDVQNDRFPHDKNEKAIFEQVASHEIVAVVEPQHIGSGRTLNIIVDNDQSKSEKTLSLVKSIQKGGLSRNVSIPNPERNLRMPPSSWHSLMKINPNAVGVVLAPYTKEYPYGRINSMMDQNVWSDSDKKAILDQITVAAAAILRVAADHVGFSETDKAALKIDSDFISILSDCFLKTSNSFDCDFIQKLKDFKILADDYPSKNTYIGVGDAHMLQIFSHTLTVYASGTTSHTHNVKDSKQCIDLGRAQKSYNFEWLTDPRTSLSHCYRHSVYHDEAISPAFLIEDYDFKNSTYSTWTESVYELDDLKLYLVQRKSFEFCMFLTGCVFALLSLLIVGRCKEDTFIIDEGDIRAEQGEPL